MHWLLFIFIFDLVSHQCNPVNSEIEHQLHGIDERGGCLLVPESLLYILSIEIALPPSLFDIVLHGDSYI
jgi:hypothetical protein